MKKSSSRTVKVDFGSASKNLEIARERLSKSGFRFTSSNSLFDTFTKGSKKALLSRSGFSAYKITYIF